jgi:hypothetical protein
MYQKACIECVASTITFAAPKEIVQNVAGCFYKKQ